MKFAHLADCHIGSWREPTLRDASTQAFCKAIDIALSSGVDFILISGDLFNTAQPPMEHLRSTVEKLKECADRSVPVYIIAGSHDYSPSGKTMLDVLDAAGLVVNVARGEEINGKLRLLFTVDTKTGAKICGMVGRKGSLEKEYYEHLDLNALESESGTKIFLFHSAVTEFRPSGFEEVESTPLSCFPKGFAYYAGGHIHVVDQRAVEGWGTFGIPGPIFPNNFQELERLQHGGFFIVEEGDVSFVPVFLYPVKAITIDAHTKTPSAVETLIRESARDIPHSAIVTLRVAGTLDQGRVGDIPWADLSACFLSSGAHCVLRNTNGLTSVELSPVRVDVASVEDIETNLIREHAGQLRHFEAATETTLVKNLMHHLSHEKGESETTTIYEDRLSGGFSSLLESAYESSKKRDN